MAKKPANPAQIVDLERPLASFDLGNANTKLRTAHLSTEFRSISATLSKARRLGEIHTPLVFRFEGETCVWGDETRDLADGAPTAFTDRRRYTSGFYRRLFAAALWRAFQGMAPDGVLYPSVVCSIPAAEYADGLADQVREVVAGEYQIDSIDGAVSLYAKIAPTDLIIVPEGAGSFFGAMSNGAGGLAGRQVAVLDIGYYTTDLVMFNRGNYVPGSAKSCNHAVRSVAEDVSRWLRQNHRYRGDVWQVDNALESGTLEIANQCVSLVEARDQAYCALMDKIFEFYYSSIGATTPGAVLMTGGGASHLYRFIPDEYRDEGWRVVSGNPRRANVDGAYLFLEQKVTRQGARNG